MAGTYSQIYIQIVFAVKGRQNLIERSWKEELYKYISGIIGGKGQKSIIVNGVSDHVHIFIGLRPSESISNLVRDIKCCSTNFINERQFVKGKFAWQEGYGAFSYSLGHIKRVFNYIMNQEEHHKTVSFKKEYKALLEEFEIKHEEKYLFEDLELKEHV
jgi:putative transposase